MSIGRNDPCHCGSDLKYKHCHHDIDTANTEKRLPVAQQLYSKSWGKNEAQYLDQGCYNWMTEQVDEFHPKKIFDVGCGNGQGVLALIDRYNPTLLASIDENHSCIERAQNVLNHSNIPVKVLERMIHSPIGPEAHELLIKSTKFTIPTGISIIEGDIILNDPSLLNALVQSCPYDLVTAWLIGTHQLRGECKNIASLKISHPDEYRMKVQNKVYKIADQILRLGGVLQIVDRAAPPDTDLIYNDFLDAHRNQASVTSLEVKDIQYMEYSETIVGNRINMVTTPGIRRGNVNIDRKAMISIISLKI